MLYDIHTHHTETSCACVAIQNVLYGESEYSVPASYCSIGIHPWYIDGIDTETALSTMERIVTESNVVAIGECGIDRVIATPVVEQSEVFLAQLRIAERVGKPVIIHAVRSGADILGLRRNSDTALPWVIHGYTGGYDLAQRLLEKHIYLSFGAALLDRRYKSADVFRRLPLEYVFFETDEKSLSIQDIYLRAAQLRDMSVDNLSEAIQRNISNVFPLISLYE